MLRDVSAIEETIAFIREGLPGTNEEWRTLLLSGPELRGAAAERFAMIDELERLIERGGDDGDDN